MAAPTAEKTSLISRLMGAPTYQLVEPHRTIRSRIARWIGRGLAKMLFRALRRVLWRWRRSMLPWYAAAMVWLCAVIASVIQDGWTLMVMAAAVGAVPMWRWLGLPAWRFRKRRDLKSVAYRAWHAGFYTLLSVWGPVAAVWTVGRPWLAALVIPAFTVWLARLWHYRVRSEPPPQLGEYDDIWAQVKPLNGTALLDARKVEDPERLLATVDLSATDHLMKHVVEAVPTISKKFGVPPRSVVVHPSRDGVETTCNLEIVYRNLCDDPVPYDATWIPTAENIKAGIVPYHSYPNGQRGFVRLFLKNAGCVNTMASGDPRVGKSESIETLLTQMAFTGMVWPMAADPQEGVSMPTWCGKHDPLARWAALDLDTIYDQLLALRDVMLARSRAMGDVEWVDEWGDRHIGINCWDPSKVDWPIIAYAVDEAWSLTGHPDFKPLFIQLLKMMGKCGMKMVLATHYPELGEFGNEESIRQAFTAGNLLAFRNTATATKNMILPSGMPGPDGIRQETDTGNHTKGQLVAATAAPRSSLPVYSRAVHPERMRFWGAQAAARIPQLDPISAPIIEYYMTKQHRCSDCSSLHALCTCKNEDGSGKVAVADQTGTVVPLNGDGPTIVRVIAFLEKNGPATSGVIARAIDAKLTTVRMALVRGRDIHVHEVREGHNMWAAGPGTQENETTDQKEAA